MQDDLLTLIEKRKAFDGDTYDADRDHARIGGQLERVRAAMSDGRWWLLDELTAQCGGTVASVSARLRDLRKPRFGSNEIEREYLTAGLWRYRMKVE